MGVRGFVLVVVAVVSLLSAKGQTGDLPRASATSQGVDPRVVREWVNELMSLEDVDIHHLMVVRHGKVVAEVHPSPFVAADVHTLYSCSKSFVSLAVGVAVDEHRLSVDDRVAALLPDKLPDTISADLGNLTVRHLLTMSSGIVPDNEIPLTQPDWEKAWLSKDFDEQGRFRYDNMCTYTLAEIVERVTGKKLLDWVREKLFTPMGISVADWEESPTGHNVGGWGLRLQAESMAKVGIMMVNKGMWHGKRLLSEEWIKEATTAHINYKYPGPEPTENNQGYCYQFWRCLCPDAVRADGAFGQFIVMWSERDLVVVLTGIAKEPRSELGATWKYLLPGVHNAALAEDERGEAELRSTCERASLPLLQGKSSHKKESRLEGIEMPVAPNSFGYVSARVERVGKDQLKLTMTKDNGTRETIIHKHGGWTHVTSTVAPPYCNGAGHDGRDHVSGIADNYGVAGNYAWQSDGSLRMQTYYTTWIVKREVVISPQGEVTVSTNYPY